MAARLVFSRVFGRVFGFGRRGRLCLFHWCWFRLRLGLRLGLRLRSRNSLPDRVLEHESDEVLLRLVSLDRGRENVFGNAEIPRLPTQRTHGALLEPQQLLLLLQGELRRHPGRRKFVAQALLSLGPLVRRRLQRSLSLRISYCVLVPCCTRLSLFLSLCVTLCLPVLGESLRLPRGFASLLRCDLFRDLLEREAQSERKSERE